MSELPMPPMELRVLVGPRDDQDFDNPTGRPIYSDLPSEAYRSFFDFGCGCGRVARQLIQQTPPPQRYVGVDPRRDLIDWAATNLSPAAPGFEFHHHNVYSPGYAPGNRLQLFDSFPVEDVSVSLAIAHSVFTHMSRDQAAFYLSEIRRVLTADGVAFTSWFFFDSDSMPFFADGPHALYADEKDFSAAVLFDRAWFPAAVRKVGLMVQRTRPPEVPGHQWEVWLAPRTVNAVDHFPLGEDGSEFLCGATHRARASLPDRGASWSRSAPAVARARRNRRRPSPWRNRHSMARSRNSPPLAARSNTGEVKLSAAPARLRGGWV